MNNIVIIGFTSSGKSAVGRLLATYLNCDFIDLDKVIENIYARDNEKISCREIFKKHGREFFSALETTAIKELQNKDNMILSTGGNAPMNPENQPLLKQLGQIICLKTDPAIIYKRMQGHKGFPAYLGPNPKVEDLQPIWEERHKVYDQVADIIAVDKNQSVKQRVEELVKTIKPDIQWL